MLSEVHQQRYRELMQALERLSEIVDAPDPDKAALRTDVLEVQQFFQEKILTLPMDALDAIAQSRMQSFQTELHKQLRLLGNEVMFLLSARQPETVDRRLSGVRDRIQTSIRYCEVVLSGNGEE